MPVSRIDSITSNLQSLLMGCACVMCLRFSFSVTSCFIVKRCSVVCALIWCVVHQVCISMQESPYFEGWSLLCQQGPSSFLATTQDGLAFSRFSDCITAITVISSRLLVWPAKILATFYCTQYIRSTNKTCNGLLFFNYLHWMSK